MAVPQHLPHRPSLVQQVDTIETEPKCGERGLKTTLWGAQGRVSTAAEGKGGHEEEAGRAGKRDLS